MATVATCGVVLQHEAMVDEVDTAKDEVARVARAHGMARSRATAQDFAVLENALRSIQERFAGQPRRLGFIRAVSASCRVSLTI